MKNLFITLKNYYLKNHFVINLVLIGLFALLSMTTQVISFVWIALMIALLVTATTNEGMCYLAFALPFSNIVRIFNISACFTGVFAFFVVFLFIKYSIKKQLKYNNLLLGLFIAFALYMISPIGYYNLAKLEYLGIFLLLIISSFVFIQIQDEINIEKVIKTGSISLIIALVMGTLLFHVIEIGGYVESYRFLRFSAMFNNPNELAMVSAFLLAIITSIYIKNGYRKTDLIFFVLILFVGFSTLSKSFMLLAILCVGYLMLHFFFAKEKINIKWKISVGVVAIIAIAVGLILFLKRFQNAGEITINSFLTGRVDVWQEGLKMFSESIFTILFGCGMGAVNTVGILGGCHNLYLEVLMKLGIVGAALLIVFITLSIIKLSKNNTNKTSIANYFPLIIIAIYGLSESLINCVTAFMFIALAFAMLNYKDKNNEQN